MPFEEIGIPGWLSGWLPMQGKKDPQGKLHVEEWSPWVLIKHHDVHLRQYEQAQKG